MCKRERSRDEAASQARRLACSLCNSHLSRAKSSSCNNHFQSPKDGVLPGTCSVSCWLHLLKASSSFKYVNCRRTNSIQASYLFKWIKATGIWKFYIRSFVLTPPPMPSDPFFPEVSGNIQKRENIFLPLFILKFCY